MCVGRFYLDLMCWLYLSYFSVQVYLFPVISSLHNLAVYGSYKFVAAFITIQIMNCKLSLSLCIYIVIACFVCLDRCEYWCHVTGLQSNQCLCCISEEKCIFWNYTKHTHTKPFIISFALFFFSKIYNISSHLMTMMMLPAHIQPNIHWSKLWNENKVLA